MTAIHYLLPQWPAPATVRACTTLRNCIDASGGYTRSPYDHFNLSTTVQDDPSAVNQNRQQLQIELDLKQTPYWIQQVHGTTVLPVHLQTEPFKTADASWTDLPNLPCAVLTADCLPLLLCHKKGIQVAAIHAGWRGLAAGVIEATLAVLHPPYSDWLVWLGPAIGAKAFEVGPEVFEYFVQADKQAQLAFEPMAPNKWRADLFLLARQRLLKYGVTQIYGGEYCTYSDEKRFYSYRRDGEKTGRMASLIWMT